jgi:hypothetical protein
VDEGGRSLIIAGAFVILACGLVLRLTDRLWLVDAFDAPSLSATGNFALGIAVAAAWYIFPLLLVGARRLTGSGRQGAVGPALLVFATLGTFAVAAYPNRRGGAYNEALDDRVPGFAWGMLAGTIPLFILGAGIFIPERVLAWRSRKQA